MDAIEFNFAVRSLANFLKTHKNVGMIVVDGLHFIANVDYYSSKDKIMGGGQDGREENKAGRKGGKSNNLQSLYNSMVPSMNEMISGEQEDSYSNDFRSGLGSSGVGLNGGPGSNVRNSFNLTKLDFNYFDGKLIDRATTLLLEYQKTF